MQNDRNHHIMAYASWFQSSISAAKKVMDVSRPWTSSAWPPGDVGRFSPKIWYQRFKVEPSTGTASEYHIGHCGGIQVTISSVTEEIRTRTLLALGDVRTDIIQNHGHDTLVLGRMFPINGYIIMTSHMSAKYITWMNSCSRQYLHLPVTESSSW